MLVHRDSFAYQDHERVGVSLPGPLGLAAGFVASIAVTMLAWAFGAGSDPSVGLVLLTLTAIVVGAMTTMPGAIGAGALCWAFYSGFVLDRAGTLTLDRGGGQALLTILLCAMVASVVAGLLQWARAVAADRALARSIAVEEGDHPEWSHIGAIGGPTA
ncbi:MAG TPA: hypothetical protein VGO16_06225 [Pseudonocardiaceae bacterium]|jgi:hypothetical protein|nr:hypothetical protein [Pseudonocardiaceae bacterium]